MSSTRGECGEASVSSRQSSSSPGDQPAELQSGIIGDVAPANSESFVRNPALSPDHFAGPALLVSVFSPAEVSAALAGGCDLVDFKSPSGGALGRPTEETLHELWSAVRAARRDAVVSIAMGDLTDPEFSVPERISEWNWDLYRQARFLKIGLRASGTDAGGWRANGAPDRRLADLLRIAADQGIGASQWVLATYPDDPAASLDGRIGEILELTRRHEVVGLLLDTGRKDGRSLLEKVAPELLERVVAACRQAGLLVGLAGQLQLPDVASLQGLASDLIGIRSAACRGGRAGEVDAARVREWKTALSAVRV